MEIKIVIDAITLAGVVGLAAREIYKITSFNKNNSCLKDIKDNLKSINSDIEVIKTKIEGHDETNKEIKEELKTLDERIFELIKDGRERR